MKKSFINPLINLLLIISLIGLTGCLDSGRSGYPSVESFGSTDSDDTTVDEEEEEEEIVRPSNAISVSNYCICQEGKPVVINNCEAECETRPSTDDPMLYVTVALTADITGNSTLKNLYGWCNTAYGDNNQAPSCIIKVYDEYFSSQTLQIQDGSLTSDSNSFSVSLATGNIQKDSRYIFEIVEQQSGAVSNMSNFKMEDIDDDDDDDVRPLRVDIINMYSCVARAGEIVDSSNYYKSAIKMNYFFAASDRPEPMPPSEEFVLCHDPYADGQGDDDQYDYPRLFEKQGIFALWNRTDGLFTASSSDSSRLEVNVLIESEVERLGGSLSGDIFGAFSWPTAPASTSGDSESDSSVTSSTSNVSSGSSLSTIGYYMQPWVDDDEIPYCPNDTHYQESEDPLFEVLGKFVDETEAIFMAKRESKTIIVDGEEQEAPIDVLLVREGVLNQIWFYHDYEAGQHKRADYTLARNQTIMFYWPPNFSAPLIPNTNSDLYVVRFPEDIGDDTSSVTDSTLPEKKPADKRFGCIPKSSDVVLPDGDY